MTADYDTEFLRNEWTGSGLDLQYTAVFDSRECFPEKIGLLLPSLLGRLSLKRWDAFCRDGLSESGDAESSLAALLESATISNLLILVSSNVLLQEHFYIEFSAPNKFSIGAPSELFYTGVLCDDRRRVSELLGQIVLVAEACGRFSGAFAVAAVVEELASRETASSYDGPWSQNEKETVVDYVLDALNEFRRAG